MTPPSSPASKTNTQAPKNTKKQNLIQLSNEQTEILKISNKVVFTNRSDWPGDVRNNFVVYDSYKFDLCSQIREGKLEYLPPEIKIRDILTRKYGIHIDDNGLYEIKTRNGAKTNTFYCFGAGKGIKGISELLIFRQNNGSYIIYQFGLGGEKPGEILKPVKYTHPKGNNY